MDLSSFVIRIIILLVPGILASKIYRKLRGRRIKKDWEDFCEIFLFSIISYIILGVLKSIKLSINPPSISCSYSALTTFNTFIDEEAIFDWNEVLLSVFIGVILAFISSYIYRYKIVNKFAQFIGASKRYGDEDVWDYFHNMEKVEWVVVRDHKVDLYYYCWIKVFSETDDKRELLLGNVTVYSSNGEFLYEADAIYISRDFYDLTIEMYNQISTIDNEKKEEENINVSK